MEIIKVAALSVAAVVIINLLNQYNKTYAVIASASATVIIALYAVNALSPVIEYFNRLAGLSESADFGCVVKAVGLGLITQTASDLCSENGQRALAGKVAFVGKCAVMAVSLPLFKAMLDILQDLLS